MREKDPFDKALIMPSGKALDAEPRDDAKTRAKSARALVVSELPRDELRREPAPKTLQSGSRTLFDLRRKGRQYRLQDAYRSVRNLEFRSREQFIEQRFEEYVVQRKKGQLFRDELIVSVETRPDAPTDEEYLAVWTERRFPRGKMMVMVDATVYPQVKNSVAQYVLDVARDGYWATIHVITGGKPDPIRDYIRSQSVVGVVMVGAVAAPWFDLGGDQFPCDLFYMDSDGRWTDPDGDGKYTTHDGNVHPELWIGRIFTPTQGGNDATLINDYFRRNHLFRLGQLGHGYGALAFVDDDWQGFGSCALDSVFPTANVTTYTNPTATDADLYKAEVNSQRSFVQLCAHSWPQGHAFTVGSAAEYIDASYFRDLNPPNAHFYNLFCCGPGRYTEPDYLAGWYIFDRNTTGKHHGLAAIASAKSGSMLFFEDFYEPMGNGPNGTNAVIGDAFVQWWQALGPDHDDGERSWHYGLVLLGDPTLSWWKGAVPTPRQPENGDRFDHWPRKMQMRWDPVQIPGVTYSVEVDAWGASRTGQWAEESGASAWITHNITDTTMSHEFVGAQPGRWRVRAHVNGVACAWSPWSYFNYSV